MFTTILKNCNWKVLPITPDVLNKYEDSFKKYGLYFCWNHYTNDDGFPLYLISNGKSVYSSVTQMNNREPIDADLSKTLLNEKDLWVSKKQIQNVCKDVSTDREILFSLEKITKGMVLRYDAIRESISLDLTLKDTFFITSFKGSSLNVYDKDNNFLAEYKRGVKYNINGNAIRRPTRPEDGIPTSSHHWCCIACKNFSWLPFIEDHVTTTLEHNGLCGIKFLPKAAYVSKRTITHRKAKFHYNVIWYPFPRIVKSNGCIPKVKIRTRDSWVIRALDKYYKKENINLGSVGNLADFKKKLELMIDNKFAGKIVTPRIVSCSVEALFKKQLNFGGTRV